MPAAPFRGTLPAMSVRTRFAPSPSGHLHVGGARTALFNWAYARRHGGTFILRIEDTDQKRSSDAAALGFLADLAWLGIDWDEGPAFGGHGGGSAGPYFQSQRRHLYDAAIDRLLAGGRAYRAFETPQELDAARAAAPKGGHGHRYDRAALRLDPATALRYVNEGRPHVVRFLVPDDAEIVVRDEVLGEVRKRTSELDDFVIRKADGFPTYHFAVVVDDELMGVTHVIRAQEHLTNTHRHVLLQDALGYRRPVYAHLSLICNPDGSKMSKRDKDRALREAVTARGVESVAAIDDATFRGWRAEKDRQLDLEAAERLAAELGVHLPEINVDDFRRSGYLPEVLVNYLALLGWSPGGDVERFDAGFLAASFDFDRVQKSPARFDRDKLLAFNLTAIQALEPAEFVRRYRAFAEEAYPELLAKLGDARFDVLARANQVRSKTLADTLESARFFVTGDDEIEYESSKAVRKALLGGEPAGLDHLRAVRPILARLGEWTAAALEREIGAYAAAHAAGKLGAVAQPLRIAVSGGTVSPAIFETLAILGRDSVVRRIDRCLERCAEPAAGERSS
jgi:glutamyl-tRNA synthetase